MKWVVKDGIRIADASENQSLFLQGAHRVWTLKFSKFSRASRKFYRKYSNHNHIKQHFHTLPQVAI